VYVPKSKELLWKQSPVLLHWFVKARLYATSLQVRDLKRPNFHTINKLDPDDAGPGYQRLHNEGRAKRLADYLLDGQTAKDAFLPTSIFLATNKNISFDSSTNTITFDVDQIGPFNVVDGQHRIAGEESRPIGI
jgi:hypothetical protein